MDAVSLRKNKWVRRAALTILVLLAFWLVAWLAVPPIVKSQLQKIASDKLGRQVTVGKVDFRPWSLELTIDDLRIAAADPQQLPQVEVGRLYADGELQSLLRLAPVVDAVRVERPQVRMVRGADGHFDFEDVLQRLAQPEDKPKSELPRFAIYNISIVDGAVDADDRTVDRTHELRSLELNIPFLSNLKSKREVTVEPKLAFVLNGSRFDSGAQTTPFAETHKTDAQVHIAGLDLAPYLGYIPAGQPYKPQAGVLDADLRISFQQGADEGLSISGTVQARQAKVTDAQGRDLLAFDALKIALADVRPLEGRVRLSEVTLTAPQLAVTRAADGRLNVVPAPTPAPTGKSARPVVEAAGKAIEKRSWQVQVDKVGLHQGRIRWRDATIQPAADLQLDRLELQAGGVRWPMDKAATFSGVASVAGATLRFKGEGTDKVAAVATELDGLPLSAAAPYLAQTLEPRLDGKLGAKVDVAWNAPALKVKARSVQADALALTQGKTTLASAGRFELGDTELDLQGRKLAVGSVRLVNPKLRVERGKDQRWMFERWLRGGAKPSAEAAVPASANDKPAKPWALSFGTVAVDGGAVSYADQAGTTPATAEVTALSVKVQNIVPGSSVASPVEISGRVGAGRADPGRFNYKGKLALKPLSTDGQLDVNALPVHAVKAYYGDQVPNIDVRRAYLNYRGSVRYTQDAAGPNLRLVGDTALEDLRVNSTLIKPAPGVRQGGDSRLLSWKTLGLRGVRLRMVPGRPFSLDVRETSLVDFFARLLIDETGHLRLQDYAQRTPVVVGAATPQPQAAEPDATTRRMPGGGTVTTSAEPVQSAPPASQVPAAVAPAPTPSAETPVPPAVAAGAAAAPQANATPGPRINFGPLTVVNGRVDFTDRFIKPNYSADLSELTGKLSAISSQPREGQPVLADLELRGKAQQTASLEITGQLNPLVKPLELDINARMRDLELAPLSPYSARYAGHGIERGKLSADLNYKVTPDGRLTATNKLVLNQLEFGDEIAGAQRTLPVRLAVALLADSNGVIDVDLPLSGSINDPQFSLGPLIWKGIVNLIVKAVTSPFRLLTGGLGGGSSDSNTVAFEPGSAALSPAARESLDKVAKALTDRPALKMTVVGTASLEQERSAYQRERLRQLTFAEKRRVAMRAGKEADQVEPVTDAEYPELLRAVYKRADITKPRNMIGLAKDLPVKDMENLLMASIAVNDESIRQLAIARGVAVRDYLLEHKLSSERLFLGAVQTEAKGADWKPGAELKLDMR